MSPLKRPALARPALALSIAVLCGLSVTSCATPSAADQPARSVVAETRTVLIEPATLPHLRMQARLEGRFGFINDTCLALVSDGDHASVVRMPEGTRVEQVGEEWHVTTPGSDVAIVVGEDVVTGGGGGISDPDALASVPAACQGAGFTQFYIEG